MNKKFSPSRKSISTLLDEKIKPVVLDTFSPKPSYWESFSANPLDEKLKVDVILHWNLVDVGIDASSIVPRSSPVIVLSSSFDSSLEEQMEEQMRKKEEGRREEYLLFGDVAMDLANRLKPLLSEAGLSCVKLSEYNPTIDIGWGPGEEKYVGLRIVLQGTIARVILGLRPAEEEIQERLEPTRKRWKKFSHRGAPISIKRVHRADGTTFKEKFGLINPCRFGEQAGGHAVYCSNPDPDAPRKCRYSWYTGAAESDGTCPIYRINPLWQEVSDDFYENRVFTIEVARRLNLVEIVEED